MTNYDRSAIVLIGNKVTASRGLAIDRDSSVIVGVVATASSIVGRIRLSAISIGTLVTVAYNAGRKLFITVVASQYRRIKSFTFGG